MKKFEKKTKIYTRTGDSGETSLMGGTRVSKSHPRVNAYGTIDELNACLGSAAAFLTDKKLVKIIQNIQNELFNIGAELSSTKKVRRGEGFYLFPMSKVEILEQIIDMLDAQLPILRNFILPGGSKASAFLHLARTITRRAERELVKLAEKEEINKAIIVYTNRLSDLLFVLARYVNQQKNRKELPWDKNL